MEDIEQLFEAWKRNREIAEDCVCDLDMDCFWHLTDQQQMKERVVSLTNMLASFCNNNGLNITIKTENFDA